MSKIIHNMSKTPIYKTWISMKARCFNLKDKDFNKYGGRRIKVCDRWRYSFQNFYEDMGDKPENMSLDRINVNGDYSPDNCRWATPRQQRVNRRPSHNSTGIMGITIEHHKYRVRIKANGKYLHIGVFSDIEEAKKARALAEKEYWDDTYF